MEWNDLSIPKLQRLHRWSLGMDTSFHPTLYNGCNYLTMLGLKLIHVNKSCPRYLMAIWLLTQALHSNVCSTSIAAGRSVSINYHRFNLATCGWIFDRLSTSGLLACLTALSDSALKWPRGVSIPHSRTAGPVHTRFVLINVVSAEVSGPVDAR